MTFKYWNGERWIRCTREEAESRRACGFRIMERAEVAPPGNAPSDFDLGQLDDSTPREPETATRESAPPPDIETTALQGEGGGAGSVTPESDPPAADPEPAPAAPLLRLEFKNSSNLRHAELGADGVVTVHFANGTTYGYASFTPELMLEWEHADSAGRWFHNNVRSKPDKHPVVSKQGE